MSLQLDPDETDSLSTSDGRRSRHSSIQGPYRGANADTAFPLYCASLSAAPPTWTYNHSLMPLRNGYSCYAPQGSRVRDMEYAGLGATLGDIGYIDKEGGFECLFNIFRPVDAGSFARELPQNFLKDFPATSLSSTEYSITENHFTPGTVLASNGIHVSTKSTSPLHVEFDTSEQRGAVVVLPEGATRENIVNPSRINLFVKEHASAWYQYLNGSVDQDSLFSVPNTALYIVTGVDRARCWSTAVFPVPDQGMKVHTAFKYVEGQEKTPWQRDKNFIVKYTHQAKTEGQSGAIFLRLLAISLGPRHWSQTIAYVQPEYIPHYRVLSSPMSASLRSILQWTKRSRNKAPIDSEEYSFYPSSSILHVMLLMHPEASVGIVNDTDWFSELSKTPLTHSDFLDFLIRVFSNFNVVHVNGIVTLERKTGNEDVPDRVLWTKYFGDRISNWLLGRRKGTLDVEVTKKIHKVLGIHRPLLPA